MGGSLLPLEKVNIHVEEIMQVCITLVCLPSATVSKFTVLQQKLWRNYNQSLTGSIHPCGHAHSVMKRQKCVLGSL